MCVELFFTMRVPLGFQTFNFLCESNCRLWQNSLYMPPKKSENFDSHLSNACLLNQILVSLMGNLTFGLRRVAILDDRIDKTFPLNGRNHDTEPVGQDSSRIPVVHRYNSGKLLQFFEMFQQLLELVSDKPYRWLYSRLADSVRICSSQRTFSDETLQHENRSNTCRLLHLRGFYRYYRTVCRRNLLCWATLIQKSTKVKAYWTFSEPSWCSK